MSNRRLYLLILGCFLQFIWHLNGSITLLGQQPAYFILGKEELNGIQVYDIIQDHEQNYLFATNEGIYYFNYHTFKKIECDEAKSNTAFNFVMDSAGIIYCHNLNNQIFEIKGTTSSIFYELKKDESKADISLSVDRKGNVIIGAAKIIVIKRDKSDVSRLMLQGQTLGPAFTSPNNEIQFHINNTDSIMIYEDGKIHKKKLNTLNSNWEVASALQFFMINRKAYAFDQKTNSLFNYNITKRELFRINNNCVPQIEGAIRIYETGNEAWVAGAFGGVTRIKNEMTHCSENPFYKNYFVSNVYKDKEGNILIGTFDHGIIVIPDMNIPDAISFIPDDPIISIYSDTGNTLFMGSSKGKFITCKNGRVNVISEDGKHPVEGIYGNRNSDLLVFDNGYIRVYDKRTKRITNISTSSLKDAAIISNEEFYLGTNNGIIKVQRNDQQNFTVNHVSQIKQRIYSVEYNAANKNIYTSTADGLFVLTASGHAQKITYKGFDIFPKDLYHYTDKILAPTLKYGVLVIKDTTVVSDIQPMVNGKAEDLKKIIIYENSIVGKSINGLFRFDLYGKMITSIHSSYRLNSKRIIDFALNGKNLWVCHAGGVQQVDLNIAQSKNIIPPIRFDEILVNDKIRSYSQTGNLNNDQRKLKFVFSSPTLRDIENVKYHYRLVGYDPEWKTQHYYQNEVTYNALAPGSYNFQLKAEINGVFSNTISYPFTIEKPFYTHWWFVVISIIFFISVVYLIYRWQLGIQNKKAKKINELNLSKLTAIRSQMNPHFIFNSLNSIQDLILKGDVEHSYSYITTFSDLVRRTLNYSDKDFIDFEQEIKLLELYLSLEKLRYKKDLQYNIEIKNIEDVMLPPLLIQPFIENSLVHGLLHKKGEKKLKISFELRKSLICTIEDNGIGREQAKAIKLRQRTDHESFSGKAIQKRFEILSDILKGEFSYVYEDLYKNGEPAGTKVILTIPVKRKF